MELVPHSEFSKLHIGQFLPPDAFTEDDSGLEQSVLGFNGCRHYFMARRGWLLFHYPDSPPSVLAGIDASLLDADLPAGVADRVVAACAPALRARMQVAEVIEAFGSPEFTSGDGGESGFYRFRVGQRWPYRVGCHFRAPDGLVGFWIVREDYFREDDV
jgi:hypothetical protein